MRFRFTRRGMLAGTVGALGALAIATALFAQTAGTAARPNILVIMGDAIGWLNVGAYSRGMMSGYTPNLDRLAAEGMLFTGYYAEPPCTAGRVGSSRAGCRSAPA